MGTIELTETGELTASPPEIQEMIEQMASARRASPQEAFEGLTFWSNGYLKIVPAES
ncbi:hypothetical protein AB0395_17195 [Streptosporangium sp. NPDC051023]|uniref:hypothetical protein n=1 Tax=Streptosporangium sp. NPDC051023 TaxID=3155410 RepID=UPI00344CA69A